MNKKEFIAKEIEKNKLVFGRWHSEEKINSADKLKIIFEDPPKNEQEALQHGNALANTENYPVGPSSCFNVGISGGCGIECFVFVNGGCEEPQEISKDDVITFYGKEEASLILESYECFKEKA
jgi:hypothetical protein